MLVKKCEKAVNGDKSLYRLLIEICFIVIEKKAKSVKGRKK